MSESNKPYLFTVTHFDDDPDRVATPLVLANNALAMGASVTLWLSVEGARLGVKGAADGLVPKSFPPLAELLATYIENGGRIGICPPCGKTHGVTDENMVDRGEWMGAAAMLDAARTCQTFSF
jgi:predicted peroxiredoxin